MNFITNLNLNIMKNIDLKNLIGLKKILIIFALMIVTVIIVINCSKEGFFNKPVKNLKLKQNLSMDLSGVSVVNGVMTFENRSVFKRVFDTLIALNDRDTCFFYSDTTNDNSDWIPILAWFEDTLSFQSLRNEIDNWQLERLENGYPLEESMDTHFIHDDFMRAILNPYCEMKIGSSYYKYISSCFLIKVKNNDWSALNDLRDGITLVELSDDNIEIEELSEACGYCNVDFTFEKSGEGLECEFYPNYPYEEHPVYSFFWDFGDGNSSTAEHPIHEYANSGNYTVTMVVSSGGCINKTLKTVGFNNCWVQFKHSISFQTASFTDKSHPSTGCTIINWEWDFGDGSAKSYSQNPIHTYSKKGEYYVKLIITDNDDCVDSDSVKVKIKSLDCCKKKGDVKDKWDYGIMHDPPKDEGKYKCEIHGYLQNFGIFQVTGAKTKHFVHEGGKDKPTKAKYLAASVSGTLYGEDCDAGTPFEDPKLKENDKCVINTLDWWPPAYPIYIKENVLYSHHYVNYLDMTEVESYCIQPCQ